ncbi:transcriptional regulator, IclR family [Loktanella atrilutea]|uniref:Transcriptional regulator, IclR family n=1 Tax=Loktanella atrilutea TaxID=366533 RepID=A0A1M5D8T9_LOKAT|nr:IclR family transcriptional regulator [Loktanella atrilutea]SHF63364.1 transcriptional regulator, IclR family [Loktanella atrilutea]
MAVHIVKDLGDATQASGSQAVDRALLLLQITGQAAGRGVSLSDLIAASGLGKPTVRRLMLALIRRGLVEQDVATRAYHLGEEAYVLGTLATPRHGLLEIAADAVVRLAKASGDTAFVNMRRGAAAVCLHREEGSFPIRTLALETGAQHPLGIGAGSLAMLSALPDAEVEVVLADNADRMAADYPSYDAALLRSDVAATRARGFALNPGRIVAGSWGVGVALRRPDGTVAGALSIAAIDSRMQPPRDAELAAMLTREAREIETRLARRMPRTATEDAR